MITLLHVIDTLGTGGAERQLTQFLIRSDRSRFRHVLCSLMGPQRFARDLTPAGIPFYTLGLNSRYDFLRGVIGLVRLARVLRPQIIHVTLYHASVIGRLMGRILGVPVLTTLVNTTYEPEWRMDNPHLKPWKVWALHRLDAVTARRWGTAFVALTPAVGRSATRTLGISPEKIAVVPRGFPFDEAPVVPLGDERRAIRDHLAPNADPLLLNVGRLVPQKGQRYVIRAMSRVLRAFPHAHLLIAGEGWLRRDLEALIEAERLERHVTLLGERQDVDVLVALADIFVFPSLFEGFGVALLEAMAQGKPAVASDLLTIRDVTDGGKHARLVPIRSPDALAEAIIALATDRVEAATLGMGAFRWARERFDIRTSVAALEQLYEAILNRGPLPISSSSWDGLATVPAGLTDGVRTKR